MEHSLWRCLRWENKRRRTHHQMLSCLAGLLRIIGEKWVMGDSISNARSPRWIEAFRESASLEQGSWRKVLSFFSSMQSQFDDNVIIPAFYGWHSSRANGSKWECNHSWLREGKEHFWMNFRNVNAPLNAFSPTCVHNIDAVWEEH